MPAYDFKCEDCSTVFEITRPIGQRGDVVCPECGGSTKRVFSPVGVVFKGSGFHNTDYRPKPPAEKEEPAPCSGTGSSACESCPAAE